MIRLPPKSTLTDPLFPSTTRFRSHHDPDEREQRGRLRVGIPRGDQLCPDGTIVAVGKGDPALLDLLDQAGPEVLDFGRAQRTCGCQPLSHPPDLGQTAADRDPGQAHRPCPAASKRYDQEDDRPEDEAVNADEGRVPAEPAQTSGTT